MRLKRLKLENFRSYSEETVIDFSSELTAFLGRNDAGKSSILEALEIFFNNETVKIDAGDLSKKSKSTTISITCVFDCLPERVVVDEEYPTTLQQEYLTNADGDLEIRKDFKIQATVGKPAVFIVANHPSNVGLENLHGQKISALKELGKKLGIDGKVEDQRVASHWRNAIWQSNPQIEFSKQAMPVNNLESDAKQIYAKLELLLPTFALFKSDRESNDVDPEAKNPLQAAVKQAQRELEKEITTIQSQIERSVIDVANRTLDKIREMDPNLANELTPRFKEPPKWTFNFTLDSDGGVPMNKRGSGARRLILLNFFRAEAEKKKAGSQASRVIYAIEEPETSQHPNYQAMLIEALAKLAMREDCQILLTTHVPALAGLLPTESIRFISKDEETDQPSIIQGGEGALKKAADSLGVLPEPGIAGAKAVLLVEGPSDITFVSHAGVTLKAAGHIPFTFQDKGIAVIPIGGCGNLKHWVTKQLVEQLGLKWSVLLDSDNGDAIESPRKQANAAELRAQGKLVILTKKREPENYIDPAIVEAQYKVTVNYTDTCDAKKIIAKATKKRPEDVLERFWPLMSADQIIFRSKYVEGEIEKIEMIEIIQSVIAAHQ